MNSNNTISLQAGFGHLNLGNDIGISDIRFYLAKLFGFKFRFKLLMSQLLVIFICHFLKIWHTMLYTALT